MDEYKKLKLKKFLNKKKNLLKKSRNKIRNKSKVSKIKNFEKSLANKKESFSTDTNFPNLKNRLNIEKKALKILSNYKHTKDKYFNNFWFFGKFKGKLYRSLNSDIKMKYAVISIAWLGGILFISLVLTFVIVLVIFPSKNIYVKTTATSFSKVQHEISLYVVANPPYVQDDIPLNGFEKGSAWNLFYYYPEFPTNPNYDENKGFYTYVRYNFENSVYHVMYEQVLSSQSTPVLSICSFDVVVNIPNPTIDFIAPVKPTLK